MRGVLLSVLLPLLSLPALAQPTRSAEFQKHYRLVFTDDFRYPSVDSMLSPRLGKWAHGYEWGNAHSYADEQCDNRNKNHAYLREDIRLLPNPADPADRYLALDFGYHAEPLRNLASDNGKSVAEGPFYKTSGLVRALYRGDSACTEPNFKYGVFEIRAKLPAGDGLQSAFWLWAGGGTCNYNPPGWKDGDTWEIDVFESVLVDADKRDFFGTLHSNPFRQHQSTSSYYTFRQPQVPADGFHTYTLVWTPNYLAWYYDGHMFKRLRNPARSTTNPTGIPDNELGLLLSAHYIWDCQKNYHCDTLRGGQPNSQQCPQPNDPFLIDYVRVYKPIRLNEDGSWPLFEKKRRRSKAQLPTTTTAAR